MYLPVPNACVTNLFGNGNISNGQRIIYIPSNAKMDYALYVKTNPPFVVLQQQHLPDSPNTNKTYRVRVYTRPALRNMGPKAIPKKK